MGKVGGIGKVVFRIYGGDHHPAHFHVIGPDFDAKVSILDPEIIEGDLPRRLRAEVLAWAVENRAALIAEWNEWNPSLAI